MVNRLFVYGTLAPGRSNARELTRIPGAWEPVRIKGKFYREGWGAASGYPGVILDDCGDDVQGVLFSSGELAGHWQRLDDSEGSGYRRVITAAIREDGSVVDAYVYEIVGSPHS